MLEHIQQLLAQEHIESSFHVATDQIPYPHLLVFLTKDFKEREQILEITLQVQTLSTDISSPTLNHYFRIQFQFIFPFKVEEKSLNQISHFVLFINQLVDFPGFELNELENQTSYRYVWLVQMNGLDQKLISSIIGIITLFLKLFTETINKIAEGTVTFNEILEEIVNNSKNIK